MKNLIASLIALFSVGMLHAQEPPPPPGAPAPFYDDGDRTPPRLSYTNGDVSFWRPGAEDWTRAQVNLPFAPGDALYAGDNANLELEIGPRSFIRAGEHTQIGLLNQEPDFLQLKVTSGHLALDVRELLPGHTIEVGTPNAVFTVERIGYYRVDVIDDTSTFVARRGGSAFITPADGEVHPLAQDEQVVITGIDQPTSQSYAAADLDAWDRWNYERYESGGGGEIRSARYVPQGVSGVRDLDQYGDWEETTEYGHVWAPRQVAADWAPYSDGRWVWDAYYGWTWVDNAPWGWAPSHYGRWVHVRSRWCWAPGPVIAAPVYAPAVVAFFGSRNVSVSIGVTAPAVGWVALGWGEPVIPWWGGHGYHGRPSWRGWGGPRVINRTVINKTTVVNVNNINIYENARVRNAVMVEREDRFGRRGDDSRRIRLRDADIARLRPVRGDLRVRPVSESLTPRRERGTRPPERVLERPVVATRPPRDTRQRLRAQGIQVRDQRPETAPRIVEGRRPDRDRGAQAAQRRQEMQRDPRSQQDVRRDPQRPETGRMDRMDRARQQQDQPAQRDRNRQDRQGRASQQAPVAPGSTERDAVGSGAGQDGQRPSGRQERVRRQTEPRQQQERPAVRPQPPQRQDQRATEPRQRERSAPAAQSQPQPRREQMPAAEAAPQNARPQREAQPGRQQPNRVERAERQRQQRQQAPAVRAQPQNARPQREAQPSRQQPNRVERAERQPQQRQQPPAVRARPQSPARQPEVRNAPRREAPRPERAQRPQRPSAGDAPKGQDRKQAPQNRRRDAADAGTGNERQR